MPSIPETMIGMATITIQAPCVNFTEAITTSTTAVVVAPIPLMMAERSQCGPRKAQPSPHHAGLAEGEAQEHADHVQLDEPRHLGIERPDQQRGDGGKDEDPIGEHQTVAEVAELAWHQLVSSEDGREAGKVLISSVGGQEEDPGGEHLEQPEIRRRR